MGLPASRRGRRPQGYSANQSINQSINLSIYLSIYLSVGGVTGLYKRIGTVCFTNSLFTSGCVRQGAGAGDKPGAVLYGAADIGAE